MRTNLAVSNSLHESRLSLSVSGADTVSVSTVKSELGVIEEEETSVGEREHDVAEKLSLGSVVDLVGSESLLFGGWKGREDASRVSFKLDEQNEELRKDEPCRRQ